MGVCVSGREGLGTPPAPPAEEALTAEHWGLISPPPPPPISTSPLTSLLLSHLLYLSPSLYSLLFHTYWPNSCHHSLVSLSLFSHFIMSIHLFLCTVCSLFLFTSLHFCIELHMCLFIRTFCTRQRGCLNVFLNRLFPRLSAR